MSYSIKEFEETTMTNLGTARNRKRAKAVDAEATHAKSRQQMPTVYSMAQLETQAKLSLPFKTRIMRGRRRKETGVAKVPVKKATLSWAKSRTFEVVSGEKRWRCMLSRNVKAKKVSS